MPAPQLGPIASQRLAEPILAADPLREATWRSLLPIRNAVGVAPAAVTRALLDQLLH
jgi:hypothetical protein